jgi:XTP/dITP diphosphohydrolase
LTERRLLLATTNPGKIREIRAAFKGLPLRIVGLGEALPGLTFREKGRTFLENARAKSLFYSRKWDGLTLAEDSGLEVEALDGAPGVISARFARPRPGDERNNRKVLRLLAGVPEKRRKARFVCVMVLSRQGRVVKAVRGEVRGKIAAGPRGANGFGYDPLFYYSPLRKTFAELPAEAKNRVSHRGRAVRKMRGFFEKKGQGPGR